MQLLHKHVKTLIYRYKVVRSGSPKTLTKDINMANIVLPGGDGPPRIPPYKMQRTSITGRFDPEEWNNLKRELCEIDTLLGATANKHDRAISLIAVCIENGVDLTNEIIGAIRPLGYSNFHIGKLIHDNTGNDPKRHWWSRDASGHHALF